MNVLAEIYNWSRELPVWQQDALRRLIFNDTFGDSDIGELASLALKEAGVSVDQPVAARPLTTTEVSGALPDRQQVRINAIKDLRNVNAIAAGQTLAFSSSGLTVMYGDNGAGKSGYSRVLKRACRARDEDESVLPNAVNPVGLQSTPSAEIHFTLDGEEYVERWQESSVPPPALAGIAVFDSRCARIYVEKENEATFVPYGLDVPERLVSVCTQVKESLKTQASSLTFDPRLFGAVPQGTWAAAAIALLPSNLHLPAAQQLAVVCAEEKERKLWIESALKEPDPLERVHSLEKLLNRVGEAVERVAEVSQYLNDRAIDNARFARTQLESADDEAALAAKALSEDPSLFPGTGSALWRKMFIAARDFADVCSHAQVAVPPRGEDGRCPLCQQPLQDGGRLFHRFQEFITDRFQATLEQRKSCCKLFESALEKLHLPSLVEESVLTDLSEQDAELAKLVKTPRTSLASRRDFVLSGLRQGSWPDQFPALPSIEEEHKRFKSSLEGGLEALREASRGDREGMAQELKELQGREEFAVLLDEVVAAIEREKHRQRILKVADKITTAKISRKATELTNAAITEHLANRLNAEIAGLRFGPAFAVELTSSTKKGATKHRLKLQMSSAHPIERVLSEGEQRALALAAFFAEAVGEESIGSLVFDDPVSSLDHARRDVIANRIAVAAKDRQVVVFTHDLYFLRLLLDAAESGGVPAETRCVVRTAEGPGVVRDGLPFHGRGTKERLGELRNRLQEATAVWKRDDQEAYWPLARDIYRDLRDTWECCVEEVILNQTVMRFGKGVATQRLKAVSVQSEDYEEVERGMSKCSTYAHDTASNAGLAWPEPSEVEVDIAALDNFRRRVEERKSKIHKGAKHVGVTT